MGYVPNSGDKLKRLEYRVDQWDKDFHSFVKQYDPVIWLGDLNVAHTWKDVWNDGAPNLPKSAGTTPEERASFTEQLDSYVDTFRHFHEDAQGQYTYWSQRAKNRPDNKGMRLDYFVASNSLLQKNQV